MISSGLIVRRIKTVAPGRAAARHDPIIDRPPVANRA